MVDAWYDVDNFREKWEHMVQKVVTFKIHSL
jgi:hypothetical protein